MLLEVSWNEIREYRLKAEVRDLLGEGLFLFLPQISQMNTDKILKMRNHICENLCNLWQTKIKEPLPSFFPVDLLLWPRSTMDSTQVSGT
jgi:hypothetical protein